MEGRKEKTAREKIISGRKGQNHGKTRIEKGKCHEEEWKNINSNREKDFLSEEVMKKAEQQKKGRGKRGEWS